MRFNPEDFGIKYDYLYEILATTFSYNQFKKELIPNTSCMGVRFKKNRKVIVRTYPNTNTFQNLKSNGYFCINFIENVYLYTLAALKSTDSNKKQSILEEYYDYFDISRIKIIKNDFQHYFDVKKKEIPFINQSWALIICKVNYEKIILSKNELGDINLSKFELDIITHKKYRESYKLFNRAENLILETIILATRLKIAKNKDNKELVSAIYKDILKNKEKIERFSVNKDVIKSLESIERFVQIYL